MPPPQTREFVIFVGNDGHPAIVDSLDMVPVANRESARVVRLPKGENDEALAASKKKAIETLARAPRIVRDAIGHAPIIPVGGQDWHGGSILLGVAVGLAIGSLVSRRSRAPRWLFKIGLTLALMVAAGSAYFTFIRSHAGLGSTTLATPATLLQDAKNAARALEERAQREHQMADEALEK